MTPDQSAKDIHKYARNIVASSYNLFLTTLHYEPPRFSSYRDERGITTSFRTAFATSRRCWRGMVKVARKTQKSGRRRDFASNHIDHG